jgi:hypothetical protein
MTAVKHLETVQATGHPTASHLDVGVGSIAVQDATHLDITPALGDRKSGQLGAATVVRAGFSELYSRDWNAVVPSVSFSESADSQPGLGGSSRPDRDLDRTLERLSPG